ncbi:hypothetical protein BZG36_04101 [Bifiguratus adelaidae]|uniref:Exosome complex protein n=1 Tax=Bifiguratus adelaidae TaxID=1938954 RepID=A0A261XW51_9FUNG|nr:hypothetical protein BZG36_04101 [Bifiguratus adelaidae]
MDAVGTEAPFGVVEALDERLDAVREQLKSLLKRPLTETVPKLSHVDRSKLFVMLSYTINTLVFVYLKSQGQDPKTHPVVRELERVRDYIEKIKTATGKKAKPSMTVNQAASKRTISAALAANRIQDKGKTSTLSSPTPSPPSTPNSQTDVKKRPAEAGKFQCMAAVTLVFTLLSTLDAEPTTHKKNKKWEKEKPKTSKKSRLPITGVSYE